MKKTKSYYFYALILPILNFFPLAIGLWFMRGMPIDRLENLPGMTAEKAEALAHILSVKISPFLPIKTLGMIMLAIGLLIAGWDLISLQVEFRRMKASAS